MINLLLELLVFVLVLFTQPVNQPAPKLVKEQTERRFRYDDLAGEWPCNDVPRVP